LRGLSCYPRGGGKGKKKKKKKTKKKKKKKQKKKKKTQLFYSTFLWSVSRKGNYNYCKQGIGEEYKKGGQREGKKKQRKRLGGKTSVICSSAIIRLGKERWI